MSTVQQLAVLVIVGGFLAFLGTTIYLGCELAAERRRRQAAEKRCTAWYNLAEVRTEEINKLALELESAENESEEADNVAGKHLAAISKIADACEAYVNKWTGEEDDGDGD